MKKHVITTLLISSVFAFVANAQNLGQSYEASEAYEKQNAPCVAIKVRGEQELVTKTLESVLKKDQLKGKVSKNILKYEKVSFPNISNEYLNLYFKVSKVGDVGGDPQTIVYAFVSKGIQTTYVSAQEDSLLTSNLKRYLDNNFFPQMERNYLEARTESQNKLISTTQKSISSLEKKISGRKKDIQNAENNIAKYKEEISATEQELQQQNNLLLNQQQTLQNIK